MLGRFRETPFPVHLYTQFRERAQGEMSTRGKESGTARRAAGSCAPRRSSSHQFVSRQDRGGTVHSKRFPPARKLPTGRGRTAPMERRDDDFEAVESEGLFIFGSLRPLATSRGSPDFETADLTMPGHQPFLSTAPLTTHVDSAPKPPNAGLSTSHGQLSRIHCPCAGCFFTDRRLGAKYLVIQIPTVTRLQGLGLNQLEGSTSVGLPLGPQEN